MAELVIAALAEEVGPALIAGPDHLSHPLLDGVAPAPARVVIADSRQKGRFYQKETFTLPWLDDLPELSADDADATRLAQSRPGLLDVAGSPVAPALQRYEAAAGRSPDILVGRLASVMRTSPAIRAYRQLWVDDDFGLGVFVRPGLACEQSEALADRLLQELPCDGERRLDAMAAAAPHLRAVWSRNLTLYLELEPTACLLSFRQVDRTRIGVTGRAYLPDRGECWLRVPMIPNRGNWVSILFSDITRKIDGLTIRTRRAELVDNLTVEYGMRGGNASFLVNPERDCSTIDLQMYCPEGAFGWPSAFIADVAVSAELTEAEKTVLAPQAGAH
jgi:hypothetical protein